MAVNSSDVTGASRRFRGGARLVGGLLLRSDLTGKNSTGALPVCTARTDAIGELYMVGSVHTVERHSARLVETEEMTAVGFYQRILGNGWG